MKVTCPPKTAIFPAATAFETPGLGCDLGARWSFESGATETLASRVSTWYICWNVNRESFPNQCHPPSVASATYC